MMKANGTKLRAGEPARAKTGERKPKAVTSRRNSAARGTGGTRWDDDAKQRARNGSRMKTTRNDIKQSSRNESLTRQPKAGPKKERAVPLKPMEGKPRWRWAPASRHPRYRSALFVKALRFALRARRRGARAGGLRAISFFGRSGIASLVKVEHFFSKRTRREIPSTDDGECQ